jgi:hypothetical protein
MNAAARRLADRFEALAMDPRTFRHRDHVATAWAMLERYPLLEATTRYAATLKEFATRAGDAEKFHATITVAFVALIAERMHDRVYADADDFCARNPDLLDSSVLLGVYSPERLRSDAARRAFVLPDRLVNAAPATK